MKLPPRDLLKLKYGSHTEQIRIKYGSVYGSIQGSVCLGPYTVLKLEIARFEHLVEELPSNQGQGQLLVRIRVRIRIRTCFVEELPGLFDLEHRNLGYRFLLEPWRRIRIRYRLRYGSVYGWYTDPYMGRKERPPFLLVKKPI